MPSYDVLWDSGTDLYISPLTRAAPYFVGIGAGYLVMFYREKFVLNKVILITKYLFNKKLMQSRNLFLTIIKIHIKLIH